MSAPAGRSDLQLSRRLLRLTRPYWLHLTGLLLIGLLAAPLALLVPLPLKIVVDSVLGPHDAAFLSILLPDRWLRSDQALLVCAVALVIGIEFLRQMQEFGTAVLRSYIGERLALDLRERLLHQMQRLSLRYHHTSSPTDSTYRIQYDAMSVQAVVVDTVIPTITASVTLVSMVYVVLRLDAMLGLVALGIIPLLFGLSRSFRTRIRGESREVKQLESTAMSVVQETLDMARVVRAFGREEHEQERFVCWSSAGLRARLRLAVVENGFGVLLGLTTAVGVALVLWLGASHVAAGTLTLGSLLLIMGYLGQLYGPLRTISKRSASLQAALAGAERVFAVLDEPPEVHERLDARALPRARGCLAFDDVCFSYGPHGSPVLSDVSLGIPAGARVAIVGETGAGKSSMISLLLRFYDPICGRVLLDGVDIRSYRLADLRRQFALVLQDAPLFSATVAENITYARPDASLEEIVEAAKAAQAHGFIRQLPQGYGTPVGTRGLRLSGGERQRISLARAFLSRAPILVLDEPTSSVDETTEAQIMTGVEQRMRGRTTLIVTHRPSLLAMCNICLEVANGRVRRIPAAMTTSRSS